MLHSREHSCFLKRKAGDEWKVPVGGTDTVLFPVVQLSDPIRIRCMLLIQSYKKRAIIFPFSVMVCSIQPIYGLVIGMGTAINFFALFITIRSIYKTRHIRAKLLIMAIMMMCIQSWLYLQWYVFQIPRQTGTALLAVATTHLAVFFGTVASWIRYSVSFIAEKRMKYHIYVVSVLMAILMYVISVNFNDTVKATNLYNVLYSKWTGILLIIPVGHAFLGLKMYINRFFSFSNSDSLGYAITVVQIVITFSIIALWVAWVTWIACALIFSVTYPPTPVIFLLESTAYLLEASVGLVTKQVQSKTTSARSKSQKITESR